MSQMPASKSSKRNKQDKNKTLEDSERLFDLHRSFESGIENVHNYLNRLKELAVPTNEETKKEVKEAVENAKKAIRRIQVSGRNLAGIADDYNAHCRKNNKGAKRPREDDGTHKSQGAMPSRKKASRDINNVGRSLSSGRRLTGPPTEGQAKKKSKGITSNSLEDRDILPLAKSRVPDKQTFGTSTSKPAQASNGMRRWLETQQSRLPAGETTAVKQESLQTPGGLSNLQFKRSSPVPKAEMLARRVSHFQPASSAVFEPLKLPRKTIQAYGPDVLKDTAIKDGVTSQSRGAANANPIFVDFTGVEDV